MTDLGPTAGWQVLMAVSLKADIPVRGFLKRQGRGRKRTGGFWGGGTEKQTMRKSFFLWEADPIKQAQRLINVSAKPLLRETCDCSNISNFTQSRPPCPQVDPSSRACGVGLLPGHRTVNGLAYETFASIYPVT